ncbi:ABC-type multidrug transport system, ATPase component [Natronococcus occultus SP4]|uniref:ABC-type multidrug transport system, ATPase component n=2 Tax=Natronococcus occultus TaxID=29288 RepID=L0JZZ1_9EURY|nr:ABC-type multidrug transport system, ATPase component [Natronococcus occultus SP4]
MPKNVDSGTRQIISAENLVATYDRSEGTVRAIDDIDLEIQSGSIVGLIGPNGAGKTTLLETMLGLVSPTRGRVQINGIDVSKHPHRAHTTVAAVLEGARSTYWRLTVRENLEFFSRLNAAEHDDEHERIRRTLDQLALTDLSGTVVNDLSRGQKQRVSLAAALIQDVDVLILDEPLLGLDTETSLEFQASLVELAERRELTIVLSSHNLDAVESICDRGVILENGRIVADDAIENLLEVFQTEVYELVIEGQLPAATRNEIERTYDLVSTTELRDRTTLEVAVPDTNRIHDLTGTVVAQGSQIESVRIREGSLETVLESLAFDQSRLDAQRRPRSVS